VRQVWSFDSSFYFSSNSHCSLLTAQFILDLFLILVSVLSRCVAEVRMCGRRLLNPELNLVSSAWQRNFKPPGEIDMASEAPVCRRQSVGEPPRENLMSHRDSRCIISPLKSPARHLHSMLLLPCHTDGDANIHCVCLFKNAQP
jgi:hypothetical protein